MNKDVFVVTHGECWAVRSGGSERVSKVFDTKSAAFEYGRDLARTNHAELRVQNRNGQFGVCNSYKPDSCPPRDKNR